MLYIRWVLMPIVSVAGYFIYQTVADVGLIVSEAWIRDCEDYHVILCYCRHVGAHEAGLAAHAGCGKLNAGSQVPAFRIDGVGQRQAAAQCYYSSTRYYLQKF